jgi:hypothetical protein
MEFVIRYLMSLVGLLLLVFLNRGTLGVLEPKDSVPLTPEERRKQEKKLIASYALLPIVFTVLSYYGW